MSNAARRDGSTRLRRSSPSGAQYSMSTIASSSSSSLVMLFLFVTFALAALALSPVFCLLSLGFLEDLTASEMAFEAAAV